MLSKKIRYIIFLSQFIILSAQAGWFDNKIEVRKCYDPKEWGSHEQYIDSERNRRILGNPMTSLRWDWDLDLKKKKALRIVEINGEISMDEFNLLVSGNLITVKQTSKNTATFDKDKETVHIVSKEYVESQRTMQCVFK